MQVAQEIEQAISGLKLASMQIHLNLALFPLIDALRKAPDYLLLDDALERNLARVTEVSADGRVPELAFENGSTQKILLVDGDELVGAKQNRVLNLSVLVGSRQKLVIPVSCVEQGRWAYHSADFRSARRSLFAKARARKMQHVTESLHVNRDRRSNQSQLWADVADKAAFCRVDSDTLSMGDVYDESAPRLSGYAAAFHAEPGQRGAVIAVDGKPVGVELFDSAAAFACYLDKLVRSYALDAIETAAETTLAPQAIDVHRFLERVQAAAAERFPALGEGEDVRLTGDGVSGAALVANGRVVHLAGFAVA